MHCRLKSLCTAERRYQTATGGRPERLVSGSDDFTMFLWEPSASKQPVARMTGHMQLINQVGFENKIKPHDKPCSLVWKSAVLWAGPRNASTIGEAGVQLARWTKLSSPAVLLLIAY